MKKKATVKRAQVDLFEVRLLVSPSGISIRCEKHKVKNTAHGYRVQPVGDAELEQGYDLPPGTERYIRDTDLMKVKMSTCGDRYIVSWGFCLREDQAKLLEAIRNHVYAAVERRLLCATQIQTMWKTTDVRIQARSPHNLIPELVQKFVGPGRLAPPIMP
jgi:hypothetical protein